VRAGRPTGTARSAAATICALFLAGGCAPPAPAPDVLTDLAPHSPELLRHDAVLVRGWIGGSGLELEPILVTDARPGTFDAAAGRYHLRGFDADGAVRFDVRFDDEALASIAGREGHHFMLVVPVGEGGSLALSRVELDVGGGRVLVHEARLSADAVRAALGSLDAVNMTRPRPGELRVQWDAERFPLLQLRDPETGAILALARHGDITIGTERAALELALSEGVRSGAVRIRPR
jgi:hypothetical protein